jgi:[ribosomal protein S18]-alanine N-acetyltransferase
LRDNGIAVISIPFIRFAAARDAHAIAEMSRDYIEHGLGWSWTRMRVRAAIGDPCSNAIAIDGRDAIIGFAIMQYGDDSAHLALLAVHPHHRQRGLGARLVDWLEQPARIAGIERIRVEARADNPRAIAFYRKQGYVETGRMGRYYRGLIDAVRLEKRLCTRVRESGPLP